MQRFRHALCGLIVAMVAPVAADAGLVMTLTQNSGSSVLLTYSGSINTSGMTFLGSFPTTSSMNPSTGLIQKGSATSLWLTNSPSPGSIFGSGTAANATLASGDAIYTNFNAPSLLALPTGYTSLSPIAGTMTFAGTYTSLGITSTSTAFSWLGGGAGRTVSLNVVSPAVPEIDPAGMGAVLALVTGALGLFERRRSRR